MLGSWLNLVTMLWRWLEGTEPSSLRWASPGKWWESRSFSTMSSIVFNWQKIRQRCGLTTYRNVQLNRISTKYLVVSCHRIQYDIKIHLI